MPRVIISVEEESYDLIGQMYKIKDNSYIHEIVDGVKKDYSCYLYGETMMIISNPYITTVKGSTGPKEMRMVKVRSMRTGFIYEVMFCEGWFVDN